MKNPTQTLLIALFISHFAVSAGATLPEDYQSWSGSDKQTYLWSEISTYEYDHLPGFSTQLFLQALGSRALLSLDKTMTHESDEMPKGRIKFIHTFGSCARAEFEITKDNPYTGLFQTGAPAIIRLGWAAPPPVAGYIPGMAIKLLVDGESSKNLQVMNSLDGQGDNQNYFAKVFSNIINEPEGFVLRQLAGIFKTASTNPFELPVNHLAQVTKKGKQVRNIYSPRQLLFQPTPQVALPEETDMDLREQLPEINPGTVLYRVYARGEHLVPMQDEEPKLIGRLVLRSHFVASEYCDRSLFFQHNDTFLRR